jgi:hypothetical protein
MFGHKLRYKIKVPYGEISLKLRQTNWNVAVNNVSVKSNNILHLFDNRYLDSTASTHINTVLCALVPSAQNGGLQVKLEPKVFNFTMDTPSSLERA